MADVPACSTAASGQLFEARDARVRRHEPVDSVARAASPVSEVSEGIMGVPHTAVELPSNDEVEGMTPLLWLGVSPSPRLGPRRRRILKPRYRKTSRGLPAMPVLRGLLLSLQSCHWRGLPRTLHSGCISGGEMSRLLSGTVTSSECLRKSRPCP